LTQNHKKSIKKEACWTISNITAGTKEQIQVRPYGRCNLSAWFLSFGEHICDLISFQTQAVIDAGLIAPLVNLLQNAEFDIKKEAAWAISNATSGGSHDQIKYVGIFIIVTTQFFPAFLWGLRMNACSFFSL